MPIRPPLNTPSNLREWTRFWQEAHVTSDATGSGAITDADIPSTIARDTEVATSSANAQAAAIASANATSSAALAAHVASADPHTVYQKESELNAANGYAGLNAASRITKGAISTDDFIVDIATKGLVLKDTQATPHYWRVTISTLGAIVTTDLGTTAP